MVCGGIHSHGINPLVNVDVHHVCAAAGCVLKF